MSASTHFTCSICLKRLRSCRLGKPEPCHHVFCFTCINEWAKNVNTCPVDRIKFNTIEVFDSIGGECVEKVYVADQTVNDEPIDFTHCEVCQDHRREHELLLCDGCDKGYHLDCLTPSLSEVPEDDWYCPNCRPIIDAQYYYDSSSSEEDSLVKWDSSSGSDIDITSRRKPTRLSITDSSGSESDSDVEEMRSNRIIQNICSVGQPRILICESSESDSDMMQIEPKTNLSKVKVETQDDSPAPLSSTSTSKHCTNDTPTCSASLSRPGKRGSYVEWLRQFSKNASSKQSSLLPENKSMSSETYSPPETRQSKAPPPRLSLKSFSVMVSPLQQKIPRCPPPSILSLPSTSTQLSPSAVNRNKSTTKRKNRGKKRRVRLNIKRQKKRKKRDCDPIRTRSKARTVASYAPQQLTFRAAARESYRHEDLDAGLQNARKIILKSENVFRHSPLRTPIKISTPQSGYMRNNSSYPRIPLRERVASEIKRRAVPEAKKPTPLDLRSCYEHKPITTPICVPVTPCPRRTEGELLDKICQNLDDLNNTKNIIQRDGTIVPLREDSLDPVSLTKSFFSKDHPLNGSGPAHYNYHQPSSSQLVTDNADDSYDSSECELVINANSKENIHHETELCPKQDSLANNEQKFSTKTFLHKFSPCPLIVDESPTSSADNIDTLIDVSSMSKIQGFVVAELDQYRSAGEISSRQYRRILERATQKVMKGKTTTLDRVKKLVLDFVNLYRLSC